MKTNIGSIVKLGLALMLFATVACVGLAFVYSATKEDIAKNQTKAQNEALKELFPDADESPELKEPIESTGSAVKFGKQFEIRKGGSVVGIAITATGSSYGGKATVLVGVGSGGRIKGVKIMEISDTPGLGANASSPTFFVGDKAKKITYYGQFAEKSVDDPFVAKGDVEAITASTITSRSIAVIVKAAGTAGRDWLAKGGVK
ncbi:electron transport complex subunit G [Spirochaetia bacterium]|nr:electron transport complex subunit G [Spirochaetia bacterium]